MTRIFAFLMLAAAPVVMADGPPPSIRRWLHEQPISARQSVDVRLARASVREVTRPGPLRVEISARGSRGLETVQIRIDRRRDAVSISDAYPATAPFVPSSECVPPAGERGAFWASDVVFEVTIFVPAGVHPRIQVMDQRR